MFSLGASNLTVAVILLVAVFIFLCFLIVVLVCKLKPLPPEEVIPDKPADPESEWLSPLQEAYRLKSNSFSASEKDMTLSNSNIIS